MLKATEIFSTRYITDDYIEDLQFLIDCTYYGKEYRENMWDQALKRAIEHFKQDGIIKIDMANSSATSNVWKELTKFVARYGDKFVLTDSEDDRREEFLSTMQRESKRKLPEMKELPPKPRQVSELSEYVKKLDPVYIYDATYLDDHPEFITILQLLRPELQFRVNFKPLFTYLRERFNEVLVYEQNKFKYIPANTDSYWETEVEDDNTVHIVNIGNIDRNEFLQKYICIPWEIGEVPYVMSKFSDRWSAAVRVILEDVQAYLDEHPNIMYTYLSEEE